ncbi:MAG: SemiSWEET transporter [Alphaproteobacteria bacterium]|nr:SemiSWEET transporter [Alphaproteobacteria bacterium]
MSTPLVEFVGTLAAIFTTLSFLPQVVKTWSTGSAADFSWLWLIAFAAGLFLWLIYGVAIASLPLIGANALTLSLVLTIAFIKWRQHG